MNDILNKSVLDGLLSSVGGEWFLPLVSEYMQGLDVMSVELRDLLRSRDASKRDAIAALAHKLRGSSLTFGCAALASFLEKLEESLRTSDEVFKSDTWRTNLTAIVYATRTAMDGVRAID